MAVVTENRLSRVRRAARAHRRQSDAAARSQQIRDEEIRAAFAEGLPRQSIIEASGLTAQRVDQIRRGGRI